jgi:exodeoxyribonuclease V alpha subunit
LGKEASTLSRELIYTALTRSRQKLVLFLQDDIGPLLNLRRLESASIICRNTSLFAFQPVKAELSFREDGLVHVAKDGTPMRSKSEVIIANELINRGISVDYEEPLYGKDGDPGNFRLPDFTVYKAGKAYYWEHLGLLSDPDYRRRWELKQHWYEANAYVDHLITTEDGEREGLDSRIVVEKIEKWLND